jgi:hypothetical protein
VHGAQHQGRKELWERKEDNTSPSGPRTSQRLCHLNRCHPSTRGGRSTRGGTLPLVGPALGEEGAPGEEAGQHFP